MSVEQISQTLVHIFLITDTSGNALASATGLSALGYQVTNNGSAITATALSGSNLVVGEIGNGLYYILLKAAGTGSAGVYPVTVTTTSATAAQKVYAAMYVVGTGWVTSLPNNIAPGANGGLPTADASNQVKANVTQWLSNAVAAAVNGIPKVDLTYALGTLLTETVGGYIAAGIKKFFDVLNGTATLLNLPLNTDYSAARAAKLDNLDAAVSTRSTYAGADTSGTATLLTRIPGTVQPQTGDSFVRLGAPAGASVSADIAEIEAETDAIQTSTAPLTFTTPNRVDASVPTASDPLSVPVPGAYAAGTAGYDIGLLPSIQASTAQIGAGTLFSPVPVGDGGVTTIVLGSSYLLADGLQLDYTLSGYPALHIGAVATWYSYTALGPYSLPGIVTAINGVRFELTAAQSARLRGQVYSIAAPLVGGDVIKTPDAPLVLLNSIPNKA